MIAPAGGNSNQITVLLKLLGDPRNRDEAAKVAKEVQASELQKTNVVTQQEDRRLKAIQKNTREMSRLFKEQTDMQRAELERQKKDRDAAAESNAARAFQREQQSRQREVQRYHATIKAGNAQLREGFNQTTEAVLKLGRGFTQLGLVGEKDMQKIVDTLLVVEGVINTTRGGIELYRGLSRAVEGYRTALLGAAAAEKALSMARGGGVAAGAAGLAGGGGIGAGAASGVAGLAGIAAPVAAGLAALASVGVAAVAVVDSFKQISQYGIGAGAEVGSFTDTVATAEVKLLEWIGVLDLGSRKVSQLEQARNANLQRLAGNERQRTADQASAFELQGIARNANFERDRLSVLTGEKTELEANRSSISAAQLGGVSAEKALAEARERGRIANAVVAPSGDDDASKAAREAVIERQVEAAKQIEAAERNRIQAVRELKGLEEDRVDIIRRGGDEALKNLHSQLDVATSIADKLKTEAERALEQYRQDAIKFAELSPGERNAAVTIKEKLDRGETLSDTERQQFAGLGFGSTRQQIEDQSVQRAQQLGFDQTFAREGRIAEDKAFMAIDADSNVADVQAQIREAAQANKDAIRDAIVGVVQPIVDELQRVQESAAHEAKRQVNQQLSRQKAQGGF